MAKYDSMRKLERNQAVREYRHNHPEASLAEIGKVFDITRQRVWEILQNNKDEQATEVTSVA